MKKHVIYMNPDGITPAQGEYTHVTRVESGALYFLAGQLPVAQDGSIVGVGDFEAQFHQVFSNIAAILEGIGATHNDIVKFNTILVQQEDLDTFQRLRSVYFPTIFDDKYPPNTLTVVKALANKDFL